MGGGGGRGDGGSAAWGLRRAGGRAREGGGWREALCPWALSPSGAGCQRLSPAHSSPTPPAPEVILPRSPVPKRRWLSEAVPLHAALPHPVPPTPQGYSPPGPCPPVALAVSGCTPALSSLAHPPAPRLFPPPRRPQPCCIIRGGDTIGAGIQCPGIWQRHSAPWMDPRDARPQAGP